MFGSYRRERSTPGARTVEKSESQPRNRSLAEIQRHSVPTQQPLPEGGPARCYLGVNVDALTVKVAAVRGDTRQARVVPHQGRPMEVLEQMLRAPEFVGAEYFAVSGHRGHISEVAAIQRALRELPASFDAVV